ncbi:acyl-CoA dehydrogenase family protein [Streptomyces sp. NPDC046215]|uniref:Acyl-CoA dehydrogenase family protein n=1 Tax=Streptomyces stramineus TaxID=173861 RepID=A0ABP3KSP6_9ACTN
MDPALSDEQDEIRRTLRALLFKSCGPGDVRAAVRTPAGYDTALWRRLAVRPGLPGLAVDSRYGGAGCGLMELALACEETARVLLPSPLTATAGLVVPLVAALGTEAQRDELLPRVAAGDLTGALVVPGGTLPAALGLTGPNGGDWAGGGRAGGVQARPAGDGRGWRLYGEATHVLDGHSAGLLLVAARTGGYVCGRTLLFTLLPAGTSGVTRTRLTALDETRPQARVELRDAPARLLGSGEADVPAALARLGRSAAVLLAAEAVGAADGALERTVAYTRSREQFGRPIGSFQAVKHRLADLYVAVQVARSAVSYAAWAAGGAAADGEGEAAVAGGLALGQALEALRLVAGEAVQLHGGIGVTWEHDVQLYFKRAASDELLFGPVHRLRARAADAAGLFDGLVEKRGVTL